MVQDCTEWLEIPQPHTDRGTWYSSEPSTVEAACLLTYLLTYLLAHHRLFQLHCILILYSQWHSIWQTERQMSQTTLFWRDPRTWQTDRQTLHDSKDCAYASHRAAKTLYSSENVVFVCFQKIVMFVSTSVLDRLVNCKTWYFIIKI